MQRFFDLLFSSIAILALLPLLIFVMIILRLTGEGEIFFRQIRVGKERKNFNLLKFATMMKNSDQIGAGTVTLKDDYRVLPVGKFLRKTKINELPQLFNILLGEMSIIGPRPLHKKQFSFYPEEDQIIITSTLPGLSGVGSIVFRDEEKILQKSNDPEKTYKEKISPEKAKLEKWYIEHKSLHLYFKLIFLTVIAVFLPKKDMKKYFNDFR